MNQRSESKDALYVGIAVTHLSVLRLYCYLFLWQIELALENISLVSVLFLFSSALHIPFFSLCTFYTQHKMTCLPHWSLQNIAKFNLTFTQIPSLQYHALQLGIHIFGVQRNLVWIEKKKILMMKKSQSSEMIFQCLAEPRNVCVDLKYDVLCLRVFV